MSGSKHVIETAKLLQSVSIKRHLYIDNYPDLRISHMAHNELNRRTFSELKVCMVLSRYCHTKQCTDIANWTQGISAICYKE